MSKSHFFLSFFGLKSSGFKRSHIFLVFINKFSRSIYFFNKASYFFGFFLALVIFIITSISQKADTYIDDIVADAVLPIRAALDDISKWPMDFSDYFSKKRTLQKEVDSLRLENNTLKAKIINTTALENENKELRKLTQFSHKYSSFIILEKVIGYKRISYDSNLLISASSEITTRGNVVLSTEGLVGLIKKSRDGIATVVHINSPELNIPVKSQNGANFIISGYSRNKMSISETLNDENSQLTESNIRVGDKLVTSGRGGIFEEGIDVAIISEINNNGIFATPVVNLDKVSYVWIIPAVIVCEN